ncbi:hypothetical protein G6F56_003460 [Rhizopus delemar]|nr:hypothetical protein G6F56_003460 [Rhizopus delemar]
MSREVYSCDFSKCTKNGKLFTPIAKSAYYTHQRTSSFSGKIPKRTLVSFMALTADRAASDEDPLNIWIVNNFNTTSFNHSPAIPSAQADEDDEEYYSCNEKTNSEDSEDDDDEPEGSL